MSKISYDQALADHDYLWGTYGPAADMTGAYVDQQDLSRLLRSPTKATARDCLCDQIRHWFTVGTDNGLKAEHAEATDPMVSEIRERHYL